VSTPEHVVERRPAFEGFRELHGKHAVVLGGAGFLGSHVCTWLIEAGAAVTCIDNLITGNAANVDHLLIHKGFRLIDYDVTDYLHVPGDVHYVLNFASPASPVDYLKWPIHTLKVGAFGTHKGLGLALDKGATFFLASTSEVYGDPLVNPQPETYWGNVNPIGPRGVYDEAKRFAEALTLAYNREHGVDTRIVRIFNSILADEQVLYDDGKELRRKPVSELAEELGNRTSYLAGYRVPAFDGHGEIHARPAVALVGHPPSTDCFEVRTRYGRSVRVTADHSLFVEGPDGLPESRFTSALKIGDRIAVARRIEIPDRDRIVVESLDHLSENGWDIDIHHPSFAAIAWSKRFELRDLVSSETTTRARLPGSAMWGRVRAMRDGSYLPRAVLDYLDIPVPDDATVAFHTPGKSSHIPARIPMSNEVLWLLGLLVAEGHIRSHPHSFFTISTDDFLLERAGKIVERELGLHTVRASASPERAGAIFVHSKIMIAILKSLGFEGGEKRIPGWVLGLPKSRLGWFLEGYREGDGVHSAKKFDEGKRHEFSTTSDSLKDDLIVAFARFGLVPSVGRYETTFKQRTGDRRYPFWRLTLANVSPWSPLDWHKGVAQRINARTTKDIVWAAVTAIEKVEPTSLVYDFSVPGFENFWAGTGVMVHNTYGPRMRPNDGRAVPAFFKAALENRPLPVFGSGSQTRSLCYVDDEVEGILRLLLSNETEPVNIGNPEEVTMLELAETVQEVVGNHPGVEMHPRPTDDPMVRRPDTTKAIELLGWKAQISLRDGLERTLPWFKEVLGY
jgi:nucleoside-diphosphate-sugar epimerase/intein/homing endonuclease